MAADRCDRCDMVRGYGPARPLDQHSSSRSARTPAQRSPRPLGPAGWRGRHVRRGPGRGTSAPPIQSARWIGARDRDRVRTGFELKHALYGKAYGDQEIVKALEDAGFGYRRLPQDQLLPRVAKDLADGNMIGWFQGRLEWGPRALGNRSILAHPRRPEMRDSSTPS